MNPHIYIFPSFWEPELRSVTRVSFHQGQHLCHGAKPCVIMPTISPFGLDGNPKILKVILPLCHQGRRVMLPLSTCGNLCFAVLAMLPMTVGETCKKMFFKKNNDWYIIKDLPITKILYTNILHPTEWGYIRRLHMIANYIIHPRHSGEIKNRPLHDLDNKRYTWNRDEKFRVRLWRSPITNISSTIQISNHVLLLFSFCSWSTWTQNSLCTRNKRF